MAESDPGKAELLGLVTDQRCFDLREPWLVCITGGVPTSSVTTGPPYEMHHWSDWLTTLDLS
jgi:hypothetical protein